MPSDRPTRAILKWTLASLVGIPWMLVNPPVTAEERPMAPRPPSAAERAGVELAASYLSEGSTAWLDRLAADSPLASLERSSARAEIEARAGSPGGATWTLVTPAPHVGTEDVVFTVEFASGASDILRLSMVEEQGGWRLQSVRSLVDPPPADTGPVIADLPPSAPVPDHQIPIAPLIGALVLGGVLPLPRRRVATALALIPLLLGACRSIEDPPTEPVEVTGGPVRLAELAELRLATTGEQVVPTEALFAKALADPKLAPIAAAWKAESFYAAIRLPEALETLNQVPARARVPLDHLVRSRIAVLQGDSEVARFHYQKLLEQLDLDSLRLEMAESFSYLGLDGDAEVQYRYLGESGSRNAEVYYSLARLFAILDDPEAGEDAFRVAWKLAPRERDALFGDPLLASLCTRRGLFPSLALGSTEEPRVGPGLGPREPIALPSHAASLLSGNTLHIVIGSSALDVPGGGLLAEQSVPVVGADTVARRRTELALARFESHGEGSLRSTARGHRLDAARALEQEKRWPEILDLTSDLHSSDARLDPFLGFARSAALTELGRDDEALDLLIRLAEDTRGNRLTQLAALYRLGEILVSRQEYELAVRVLNRVRKYTGRGAVTRRMLQVQMMHDLAQDDRVHETRHFRIHYSRATGDRYPAQIGRVLEEERKRIARWIPVDRGDPIEVDLFPLEQFLSTYSDGVPILGLYDGRVRVPFADLKSLRPELVSILSHELAHAMIAQRTDNQAPKWFHEGLAQHVEMLQNAANPIPELFAVSRVLALPVVQSVLDGFAEAQFVDLSYDQAAWTLHYIESRHGVAGIHRLLEAFAEGQSTPDALASAFETDVANFDRDFWHWSIEEAPTMWPSTVRRYDEEAHLAVVTSPSDRPVPRTTDSRFREMADRSERSTRQKMSDWHATYDQRAGRVRKRLGPVIRWIRQGMPSRDMASTCRGLAEDLDSLLRDSSALRSADPRVNRNLRSAFRSFRELARDCRRGEHSRLRIHLSEGERSLGAAAAALERYGLRP